MTTNAMNVITAPKNALWAVHRLAVDHFDKQHQLLRAPGDTSPHMIMMMLLLVIVGTDDGEVSVNHMHDTIGEMRGHRLA